jgi:hypothetical protein
MDKSSEMLLALKPVTFRYKKEIDPAGTPQLGLVTEDVEKVNPDLVVRDKEGKPYSVRYDQVNAMLLNAFLKQHRNVADIETRVAELAAWIDFHRREQKTALLTMYVSNPDWIWNVSFVLFSSVVIAFEWHGLTPGWHRLLSIVVRVACSWCVIC